MTDFVLRTLPREPEQPRDDRFADDVHQIPKRVPDRGDEFLVVGLSPVWIAPAAQEAPQQDVAFRRATWPFRTYPCRGEKRCPFALRHDKAAAEHGTANLISAITERHGCS